MRHIIAICIFVFGSICFTHAVQANAEEGIEEHVEGDIEEHVLEEEVSEEHVLEEVETSLVDKIIHTANELIGVRYKASGNSPSTGFDCSGFTNYVFAQHGITLQRSSSDMYKEGIEVERSKLEPGDLVFFNTSGNGISHVGIYVGNKQFIHSSTSSGVVITSIDDPYYWSKRYVGAKRIL